MTNSIALVTRPPATPASQSASFERLPAKQIARITGALPTMSFWMPPRMPGRRSSRRALTHSRRISVLSTTSFANTAQSGPAKSTSAISRTLKTHGRNEPSARISRKWNSTTSSRRMGRPGIENTHLSIRRLRRRCSDRDAIGFQELNLPRPDCSWSSGSMTWGSSLPGLLTRVEIS